MYFSHGKDYYTKAMLKRTSYTFHYPFTCLQEYEFETLLWNERSDGTNSDFVLNGFNGVVNLPGIHLVLFVIFSLLLFPCVTCFLQLTLYVLYFLLLPPSLIAYFHSLSIFLLISQMFFVFLIGYWFIYISYSGIAGSSPLPVLPTSSLACILSQPPEVFIFPWVVKTRRVL